MNWQERNAPLVEGLNAYIDRFSAEKPTALSLFKSSDSHQGIFPFAPDSDKGLGMLLHFSALFQEIGEERLSEGLGQLYQEIGDQIFRLNKIPFDILQSTVNAVPAWRQWPLLLKVPGILRSVCDFFFTHGGLRERLSQCNDGEEEVAFLAREIFLMGKTSLHRFKARYFLWLCGLASLSGSLRVPTIMPPLTGGHVRFMSWVGPYKGVSNPPLPQRLEQYHNFLERTVEGGATRAFIPLEAFLNRSGLNSWKCRTLMGNCSSCPLERFCPGKIL